MRKIYLLITLLSVSAVTQANVPVNISGRVTDADGSPLSYATVVVKEKMTGVSTADDGSFVITLPAAGDYTLAASYLGYETQERTVSSRNTSKVTFRLPEDPLQINTIVITGTRTPKLLKDAPVQTRVITAYDIAKSDATDIADVLKAELPAVEFSYSMNQQVSLNMHGFGGTSILFLIDGERLAGETLDNVDYARLGVDNIDRVEIVKGAASSLYGSNAVGGVVNIITRGAEKPWSVNLNTRYGTHNSQRHGVTAGFKQGRVNSVTSFNKVSQDGYALADSGDYTTLLGNRSITLKERLSIGLSDRVRLVARGGYYFRERDSSVEKKNRYRGFSGGLRMNYDIAQGRTLEVGYAFDQYDKSDFFPEIDKDYREYSNIQNTLRALYNHTFKDRYTVTLGGDAMTDYLTSYQFENHDSKKLYSGDVFTQFDWQVASETNIIAGVRFDYFSFPRTTKMRLSPKIGLMQRVGDATLRAAYAGGFRAPTLKEMYMDFDMGNMNFWIFGNKNLKSETSHNFSLSGEYAERYWNLTVSGYFNSINDRITTVRIDGVSGMQYTNTRRVNIAGGDANLIVKLPCGFGGQLSYAYTHEIEKKGTVNTSDARPHTGVVKLEYGRLFRDYSFNVVLSGRFMSQLETNILSLESGMRDYVAVRYPGYTMWKVIVSQKIWQPFTLNFTVDNILNYKPDYFHYNSPLPYGRTFSVGLSMNVEQLFSNR